MARLADRFSPEGSAEPRAGGPPALLPWQAALLVGACGIFSIRYPLAGALSAASLWLAWVGLAGVGRARTGLGMAAVFLLGLSAAWAHLPAEPELPGWVGSGEVVAIQGVVDEAQAKPGHRLTVLLREVRCVREGGESVSLPGRLSWYWHVPTERICPGRTVLLHARVDPVTGFTNPGAWDFAFSRRLHSVHTRVYSRGSAKGLELGSERPTAAQAFRISLSRAIINASTGQGGALLAAMLTGDRFSLEPETLDLLRFAGLSHTLALSGLHLGFVAMLGIGLAWAVCFVWPGLMLRIPRPKLAVLAALPLVAGYLWLGGFAPSLLRAALMFGFMGAYLLQGRGRAAIDGLFSALAVILIAAPLTVFDIRLQLSAVAVGGIILFYSPLHRAFGLTQASAWVRWPLSILAVSLCATLCILPISARAFGMFAPNLLLNLFWLPLLGFVVMPLGLVGVVAAVFGSVLAAPGAAPGVSASVASWCFGAGGQILEAMLIGLRLVQEQGLLPSVQLLRPLWPEMLGCALLLACLAACLGGRFGSRRRHWWVAALGLALLAAPHVQVMAEDAGDSSRLAVMDVGHGQCLVITAPGGNRTVVDGGGLRSRTFEVGRDIVAPFLTLGRPPRLDLVVLTHPHADHYKGLLHLLTHFDVRRFAYGHALPGGDYRTRFRKALSSIPTTKAHAGDVFSLGAGLRLDAVHPPRGYAPKTTNDGSLVLRLTRGGQALALLCGDVELHGIEALLASGADLRADALVLPHHGSHTSLSPDFYAAVSARVGLCSSGYRGRGTHPHPEVVDALAATGCLVRSTWEFGMLRLSWPASGGATALELQTEEGISAGKLAFPPEL